MGITNLAYLIYDLFPQKKSQKHTWSNYTGKIIALDANQYLYHAMGSKDKSKTALKKRSPLLRTFYNCIRLLENGIKPVYVFDGQPPKMKKELLKRRKEIRETAIAEFKEAEDKGDIEGMQALKPLTVKVERKDIKSHKGLLKLMGIPYLYAPGEAEAQCAVLVQSGKAYAAATQDMDALTYGTKVVLRNLPFGFSSSIQELHLDKVLSMLQLSLPEFIDLSILLGCDFCSGIGKLGPHRAIEFIHKYHNIESILDHLDRNKFDVPDDWLYKEARDLFLKPRVTNCEDIYNYDWKKPDEEGVVQYLLDEHEFEENHVRKSLKNIPDFTT